jgi:NADPH-dependent methylglyoxal reductase
MRSDQNDYNPMTYEEAADPALDMNQFAPQWRPFVTYCASKALAERSAWVRWLSHLHPQFLFLIPFQEYYKKNALTFSLATINPVYIGGPYVLPLAKGVASFSSSDAVLWQTATDASKLRDPDYLHWVDVRDVARAHIAALERPEANGKRYLTSSTATTYEEVCVTAIFEYPGL